MSEKILVTGKSGFIAGHLAGQLLQRGYTVRATVRSLANEAKVAPLRRLEDAHRGRLELFEADLLRPGSFDVAMTGCRVVFHVASPFLMPEHIKDGRRDVLEPALSGTREVLGCANRTPSAVRVLGPKFGLTQDYITRHLGIRFAVANHRSVEDLGVTYRPVAETVLDHYASWRDLRPRRRV